MWRETLGEGKDMRGGREERRGSREETRDEESRWEAEEGKWMEECLKGGNHHKEGKSKGWHASA